MIYISYTVDGGARRDTRIVEASPEAKAAVQAALGATQNVNVQRVSPAGREMSAEEAAQDFLARPDLYTATPYDPYMRSLI